MSELRTEFEKSDLCKSMVGRAPGWEENLRRYDESPRERHPGEYMWSRLEGAWQGFQSGHAAGLEQQAKRIAELEAQLANLSQFWCDDEDSYSDPGDYMDNVGFAVGDTFNLTRCYTERKPRRFRVLEGDDYEEIKEGHSATALGGPTPVTVAAPACERKE